MSEQYTPTTEQVEDALAFVYGYGLGGLPECPENVVPEDAVRRWLAKRDAEVAAKAWDQGFAHSVRTNFHSRMPRLEDNPYREEQNNE